MTADLAVEFTSFGLLLIGCCDLATAPRLDSALRRWEPMRRRTEVDTSLVTFADSRGLMPLAESVRRSRQLRRPELRLTAISRPVARVLGTLDVLHDPFDLRAWDAAPNSIRSTPLVGQ